MQHSLMVVAIELNGKVASCDEHVFGKNPNWVANMQMWGESGVVKE